MYNHDLARPFDCVNNQKLYYNLEKYGIKGLLNNMKQSYLKNRQQFVYN